MRRYRQLEGFATRRTRRGACVVEIDLEADPVKRSPQWQETIRRKLTEAEFQREYKRNWTVAKGRAFYPEFVLSPHLYVHRIPHLMDDAVYRGFDFGYQKPACVWAQYSRAQDRIWFIRELMPENIDTHAFAELVRYLSGQSDLEEVKKYPKAAAWLDWIIKESQKPGAYMPAPPWFDRGQHFIDWAGNEANKRSATVEGEHAARTDADVMKQHGIFMQVYNDSIESRETKMRKMLIRRTDGLPGLFIDPACHWLRSGFGGGVAYPEPSRAEPEPKKPRKDGHFEHIHDAANYIVINVVPEQLAIDGGAAPGWPEGVTVVDLKETRESVWD